jgi:hypothetical protein
MNTRVLPGLGFILGLVPGLLAANPKNVVMTHPALSISVAIARPPAQIYDFVANSENLPLWAPGLSGSIKRIDGEWISESPMGEVKIRFVENNSPGLLDHRVTLETGVTFYNPMRVQPNGDGSEVVFTPYRQPGTSE